MATVNRTVVSCKAHELKAGDNVVTEKGYTALGHTVVGRKYVMLWNAAGVSLGRIGKDDDVQVERVALTLDADELYRVKLALAFEVGRVRDLIEQEDTATRRANLALTESISARLSEV